MRIEVWLLCATAWLQGFEFVFIPDYAPYASGLFPKGPVENFGDASYWGKIKYLLNREGYTVSAATITDVLQRSIGDDVQLVCWSDVMPLKQACKYSRSQLAILLFEPPSVTPKAYASDYLFHFSKVISWYDDWIDGEKFHKFCYGACYPMTRDLVPFSEKRLCCVMAGNKRSDWVHELYSERIKTIQYFNQFPDEFDLYGTDWAKCGFQVYKGWVEDKVQTLKYYRFNICYENTKEASGYITEKIFDCFQAGVVPIYWGAPNIADEIPVNCFIDRGQFASHEELHAYLRAMPESTYLEYLDNIRQYLQSEQARRYTVDGSVLAIVSALIGKQFSWDDLPK